MPNPRIFAPSFSIALVIEKGGNSQLSIEHAHAIRAPAGHASGIFKTRYVP
jgi:hypothetical protein